MEAAAFDIERLVAGHDSQFGGRIRLTTTEVLASYLIVPEVAALRERYPQLQVEILTGIRPLDIARREAEIAVRLMRPTAPSLVCRKLGDFGFTLYASPKYLSRHGTPVRGRGLRGHGLIAYIGTPSSSFGPLFMGESLEGAEIVLRSNDITVQAKASAVGLGISELSCIFGDTRPELVRVWPREAPTLRPIWLVVHEDLRRAARIRLVSSAIAEAVQRHSDVLRYGHRRRTHK